MCWANPFSIPSSPSPKLRQAKHPPRLEQRLSKPVNFLWLVVDVKASPCRSGYPVVLHQWLGAVVTCAHRNALLVQQHTQVSRVGTFQQEAEDARCMHWRADSFKPVYVGG